MSEVAMQQPVIACRDLSKSFREGEDAVEVLSKVSLEVARGERVAVVGSSTASVVSVPEDLVVPVGKRLRFKNHASRAPVALLATGSVRVDGEIDEDVHGAVPSC